MYAIFTDARHHDERGGRSINMIGQCKTLKEARNEIAECRNEYESTQNEYNNFIDNDEATTLRIAPNIYLRITKIGISMKFTDGTLSIDDEIIYKRTYRPHNPLGLGYDELRETLTKGDLRPALRYKVEYYRNGGSGVVFYLNGFPHNTPQNYH